MTNEELVIQYQDGNLKVLEDIINNNSGIIAQIANKYASIAYKRFIEFDDLFNTGVIGLIKAANSYSYDNRTLFISYLYPCIRREILNYINGRSTKDKCNIKLNNESVSLNTPNKVDEDLELIDTIEGINYGFENIEDIILLQRLREELDCAMKQYLSSREEEIIKLSYGWDEESIELKDISIKLGITREDARQIRANALRKLRNSQWTRTKGKEYKKEIIGQREYNYN